MNTDQRFRQFLKRGFAPFLEAPQAQVDSACNRVLQQLREYPEEQQLHIPTRSTSKLRWPAFALVTTAIVIAVLVPATVVRSAPAILEDGSGSRSIRYGEIVRGGMLKLSDGSRVEVRSESQVLLEPADEGVRVRVQNGDVIVSAAQRLVIETKDMSAAGKVFLVNAAEEGSRVAVIGGEASVHQGITKTTLKPGDQTATNPKMEPQVFNQQIAWSREAPAILALLQQSTVPQSSTEARLTFEEASIRLSRPPAAGGRGAGGPRRRNPRPDGEPCGSPSEPVIDPRRFDASETTVHALIAWAYGLDCNLWRGSDLLLGGPQWTKNDGYDIQALIPEGTPRYTRSQWNLHQAPELQRMLQSLLAERFSLVVHRETREIPAYILGIAKGGPRMIPSAIGKKADVNMITLPNGNVVRGPGFGPPRPPGLSVWKEGDDDCCPSITPEAITGVKQSMSQLAKALAYTLGRPVLNQTGLNGDYNYDFAFEPQNPPGLPGPSGAPRPAFLPPADTRSIFAAIEQDLGLKLESAKEKIDVLVIDRIERPTEN
jgi:uncharacterized protein (TIGR03435 family)